MYKNFVSKRGKESFEDIMAALQRGEIPTPAQLNEFFKEETIADTPKGDFAKNGKEIIRGIAKNLGNNPAKINELNLVLHAAYFQDVELVARLISLNGVNVNIAGVSKEGKIRGATAIGIAASIIGSNESELIFELLADKLLSEKKTGEKLNVGDWIAWGIGGDIDASGAIDTSKQETQVAKTTDRLNVLSTDFTLKQDEVLRLMAKVTELNPPEIPEKYKNVDRLKLPQEERANLEKNLEKIEKARESFIKTMEKFRKAVTSKLEITDTLSRDENNFLSTRIEMVRYQYVESEIPSYKLKLAMQCVALMDQEFNVNEDAGVLSKNGVEFFHRLKKLQSAVTALDPTVRDEFRKFIKNPHGHIFEKLIEVVADNAKLAEFSKKLASNPTLYKLYQEEGKNHSHLKPLLDVVDEGINKELEKAGVVGAVKGFFGKKATKGDLEKLLDYSPIRPDDFVQVPTLREEVKAFMQKCLDTGLVTKKDLPNYGVISTTATEKDYEAFVKGSFKAVAYKWQGMQTDEVNKTGKVDDLTKGFVTKYIELTEKVELMSLRDVLNTYNNMETVFGTHTSDLIRRRERSATQNKPMEIS